MRYALLVAYDGTNYGGWQIQKNTLTVQEVLTDALEKTLGCRAAVTASGRTDSGVHAAGQVCHFDAQTSIPAEKFADALNFRLPPDISVLKSAAAPDGFDCTRDAKKKTYCYRVYLSQCLSPLKDRYAERVKYPVDLKKLIKAAKLFEGEHDFKAYCASGSQVKTTVRRVYAVEVKTGDTRGSADVEIYVTGNGFLYNMVRTLAGTMLYFAAGRLSERDIINSLERGDRSSVGKTMPAKGLTLESVDYGFKLF
ncbi:MAG TPA: tRNA pseudouridine(38-40) synthase TruA [Clostridiales bacterium]|nr:tRNA pseudouridine(38-40) synthase TruA [Clostridiales bacterium]